MKWQEFEKLIENKATIQFNEIRGKAKIVDGVAAGGPWIAFKFISGRFRGKTLYCTELNEGRRKS